MRNIDYKKKVIPESHFYTHIWRIWITFLLYAGISIDIFHQIFSFDCSSFFRWKFFPVEKYFNLQSEGRKQKKNRIFHQQRKLQKIKTAALSIFRFNRGKNNSYVIIFSDSN